MLKVKPWRRAIVAVWILLFLFYLVEKFTSADFVDWLEILSWQQATLIFSIVSLLLMPEIFYRNNKNDPD